MSGRELTITGFLVIGLAVLVVQLWARREGTRVPSLGELAGFAMRGRLGRLGVLLVWWWLGWHFLAR